MAPLGGRSPPCQQLIRAICISNMGQLGAGRPSRREISIEAVHRTARQTWRPDQDGQRWKEELWAATPRQGVQRIPRKDLTVINSVIEPKAQVTQTLNRGRCRTPNQAGRQ